MNTARHTSAASGQEVYLSALGLSADVLREELWQSCAVHWYRDVLTRFLGARAKT